MLTHVTTRCPEPLVEQTQITRISKRIEASKDKTESWLAARPSFDPPSFNREDMQRMHTGEAPPPDNLASRSLWMRWCCRCPVMETPALELASEGVFLRVLTAPLQLLLSRASALRVVVVAATPATTAAPPPSSRTMARCTPITSTATVRLAPVYGPYTQPRFEPPPMLYNWQSGQFVPHHVMPFQAMPYHLLAPLGSRISSANFVGGESQDTTTFACVRGFLMEGAAGALSDFGRLLQ